MAGVPPVSRQVWLRGDFFDQHYQGNLCLGLGITIFLTAESIIFWQLASLAKTEGVRIRPMLITFAIAYCVFAAVSSMYFFIGPVIAEVLIAMSLVSAIATAKSPSESFQRARMSAWSGGPRGSPATLTNSSVRARSASNLHGVRFGSWGFCTGDIKGTFAGAVS